jgi:hypothetical protein
VRYATGKKAAVVLQDARVTVPLEQSDVDGGIDFVMLQPRET